MLPAKIKGLNQDTSDESNDEEEETTIITKEALEQKTQQGYREALILQKQNKLPEAEKVLKELLQSDILVQADRKVQYVNGKLQPSMSHLKYCCFLNLGNILFMKKDFESALEYYLQATELDDTDLNLWYKLGSVAMKIPNLMFAISAFMEALVRNPHHWPSLDLIISATYAVNDYMAALLYISQSLKLDPDYLKGMVLKERIMREHPVWVKDFKEFYPEHDLNVVGKFEENEAEAIFRSIDELKSKDPALNVKLFSDKIPRRKLLKPLTNRSWLCLGKALLKLYKFLYDCVPEMAFFSIIDVNTIEDEKTSQGESETNPVVPATEETTSMETDEVQNPQIEICDNDDNKLIEGAKPKNDDDEDEDDVLTELVSVGSKANENEKDSNEGTSKPTKRRKCSPTLADQLKICDKRRSTRNKTVLKSNEQSLSKTLKNLIPTSLLPEKDKISKSDCYDLIRWNEDSFDTMDIYRLLFEHQDQNNFPSHPKNDLSEEARLKLLKDQSYFGTEKEKKDIDWYISLYNNQMIFELIEAYLRELANKWNLMWPAELADIFIEMYQILIDHGFEGNRIRFIQEWDMKSDLDEESLKMLKAKADMILLYGELLLNQCLENPSKEQPLGTSLLGGDFSTLLFGDLRDACSVLNAVEKDTTFWMRTCWLEALLFLQKKDTFATCSALSLLIEEVADADIEIRLPNLKQFHLISVSGTKRLLNTLVRNQNLNEVKILFSENQFDKVIEILQETLKPGCQELMYLPNENTLTRYQQYELLFAALWESKNYEELFRWCEIACYEGFSIYRKSFFDEVDIEMKSKWALLVMNTMSCMLCCLKTKGFEILDTLKPELLSRLVQTLSNLVCHQIEATEPSAEITADVVTPWILLANLISYNEKKEDTSNADDISNEPACILPSVSLLLIAHEHLGKRNWCCSDEGALLFFLLNVIEPIIHGSVVFSETWMTLTQQVDQIFYCLYAHPFKRNRARHVQEHYSTGLALTWNRAIQAYLFYRPITLPIYDATSKHCTISADTETLLKRMVTLVPEGQNPTRFIETMQQYMNGAYEDIPENENRLQEEVADLYYLLGDYYFKNKIMGKAIKYYSFDVCSNPRRVDSWAAMALARGSQLEMKLNSCETITNECEILKRAELTDKCYRTALKLDYHQSTLWIEFGVFCYGIHGFCSRLLKQETTNLSIEMFNMVELKKNNFLKTAFTSFNNANNAWLEMVDRQEEVQDERWLHHYMLGKIAEKKEEDIIVILNHYFEAAKFLHENGAEYPMRIVYSSPQYYSVEALEIHYRIHATILKLLESHEERPIDKATVDWLLKFVAKVQDNPFVRARMNATKFETTLKSTEKTKDSTSKEGSDVTKNLCTQETNVDEVVKELLEEILVKVVDRSSSPSNKRKLETERMEDGDESGAKKTKKEIENTLQAVDSDNDLPTASAKTLEVMETEEESSSNTQSNEETIEESKDLKASESSKTTSKESSAAPSSSVGSSSDSSSSEESSSSSSGSDDDSESESEDEKEGEREYMDRSAWETARKKLAENCIQALDECKKRFPEHYKTFYRLSHHYFRSKLDRDDEKARKLLIEEGGLFADRTNKNFFGGIWRIPTAEIDRSGSFTFHMNRSIHLLLDILRDTKDYKTLLDMSTQLRCKPDLDKKYLRDNEREEICREALSLSGQTLRKIIDDLPISASEETKRKMLLDVYKCYHRVSKSFSQKEAPLGKLLIAMFYKYTGRKDKINVEQILTFCKSLIAASKSGNPTIPMLPPTLPMMPIHAATFMEESDVGKALTQVINMALNETKPPLLNYPSPVVSQAMLQKLTPPSSSDARPPSNYRPLPTNLKMLPSSISVTAVPKPKQSSQPKWEALKNANTSVKIKPLKRLTSKLDKPLMKLSKPKEKQFKNKSLPGQVDHKGLSIIPVSSSTVPGSGRPNTVPGKTQSHQPKLTMTDLLNVSKENTSLVITPVENKNQPTLQQKLAAKQLANTARNASETTSGSSKLGSKSSGNYSSSKNVISSTYDVTRGVISSSLSSSGTRIFPLPTVDSTGLRFGGREAQVTMAPVPFHSRYLPSVTGVSSPSTSTTLSVATKTKASKKSEMMDLNRLKAMSKSLIIEAQTTKSKLEESSLKSSFKALESNKDIIIIPPHKPKLPKSNTELEIITLKDKK